MNELLCILSGKFPRIPRATLVNTFAEFYTDDEIADAKKVLLDLADTLTPKPKEIKRITNRVGDGKNRRHLEDLLTVYSVLDAKKFVMPRFLASDVDRIPSMKNFDVSTLTAAVTDIDRVVKDMVTTLNNVKVISEELQVTQASLVSSVDVAIVQSKNCEETVKLCLERSLSAESEQASSSIEKHLYSAVVRPSSASAEIQKTQATSSDVPPNVVKDSAASMRRKITGCKSTPTGSSAKLVAQRVEKEKFWHIFVGKLNKESTEADVTSALLESDIRVSKVTCLKPRMEWQKLYSAFRVRVAYDDRDKVKDSEIWPSNADVRDWAFKIS